MTELKPCPLPSCKSNNVHLHREALPPSNRQPGKVRYKYFVRCRECGLEGPKYAGHQNQEAAVDKWNTRASPWVSVKDRLPKKEDFVFVREEMWWPDEPEKRTWGYDVEIWIPSLAEPILINSYMRVVTHWMPIPPAPEGE